MKKNDDPTSKFWTYILGLEYGAHSNFKKWFASTVVLLLKSLISYILIIHSKKSKRCNLYNIIGKLLEGHFSVK